MHEPTVLARSSDSRHDLCLTLHIPAHSPAFDGHFPDFPLLPGVYQIDWALHFAAEHWGDLNGLGSLESLRGLKFMQRIQPNQAVELRLRWQPPCLHFHYQDDAQKAMPARYSEGRAVFGAAVSL